MSNAGFKGGRASYASLEKQMEAFDQLPASVRAALANAIFNWASFPLRRRFEAGQCSAKELVKQIGAWDRAQIAKDRVRVWKQPAKPVRQRIAR
jgi:hypothetical protein